MTDFELSGLIDIDTSSAVDGATDAGDAMDEMGEEADEASESLLEIDKAGAAAGGAMAGVGTAAQSALDDTREMREELNRAGQAAGLTQDEMVDLTTDLSDATLETEDAAGALGALAEQGVDTEAELAALTSTADDIADATGESATVVAEDLGPAMAAVGDDIEDMDEVADGVVSTVNETNLEFTDFTRTVERSRDELNEMGLSTDETATLMGEFAEETGLSGRELRREFSSELEDADGDLEAFAESTGINIDSQEDLQDALEDSEGATDDYADAVDDNTSLMDDLRVGFQDVTLQAGNMLGPVSAAAPAMQAAGIAALTLSTINVSALIPSLTGVVAAAAPVILPLAGIAAAAVALHAIFGDDLIPIIESLIDDALVVLQEELGPVIDEFETTAAVISETLEPAIEAIRPVVERVGRAVASIVETRFGIVTDVLEGVARLLRGDFVGAFEAATDTIQSALDSVDFSVILDPIETVSDAVTDLQNSIGELLDTDFDIDLPSVPDLPSDGDGGGSSGGSSGSPSGTTPTSGTGGSSNPGDSGLGGGTGSADDAFRDPDRDTPPGFATGGLIASTGAAIIHEGERVVPDAQVDERGGIDMASTNERLDAVLGELRQLRQALESNGRPVNQRDILKALGVSVDRQGRR